MLVQHEQSCLPVPPCSPTRTSPAVARAPRSSQRLPPARAEGASTSKDSKEGRALGDGSATTTWRDFIQEGGLPLDQLLERGRAWVRDFRLADFEQQGGYLVVAQLALLLAVLSAPGEGVIEQAGVLSVVAGAGLASLGVLQIGANNFTALPQPSKDNTLTTSGIYGIVRHPMYSGLALCAFGFAAATNSVTRALFACALFAVLNKKVEREEEDLTALHPGQYEEYKKRVKRLIPYLY